LLPTQDDSGDTFQQQNWGYMKILGRDGQGIITLYTEIDPSTNNTIDVGLTTKRESSVFYNIKLTSLEIGLEADTYRFTWTTRQSTKRVSNA
jgi:hypothetical protein